MGTMLVVALTAASLLVTAAGAAVRSRGWSDRWAVLAILAGAAVTAAAVGEARDPEVTDGEFLRGLAIGVLGMWVVPASAYYALGRLVRHRVVLGAVWLLSLPGIAFWLVFALILTLGKVACPTDAYECPL